MALADNFIFSSDSEEWIKISVCSCRPPEDHASFERSSHFYERREGDAYLRRPTSAYHVTDPLRGRTRDRLYRNGPYTPLIESNLNFVFSEPSRRTTGPWGTLGATTARRAAATPPPPPPLTPTRRRGGKRNLWSTRNAPNPDTWQYLTCHVMSYLAGRGVSQGRTQGQVAPGPDLAAVRIPAPVPASQVPAVAVRVLHLREPTSPAPLIAVSAPHVNNVSPAVQSDDRRPLAICVRNLPIRSSACYGYPSYIFHMVAIIASKFLYYTSEFLYLIDTSLKDGLFHEYKKHGKVTWVKVVGQAGDRYALVCFKKADDVEKALEESHNKLFFGCKIEVAPYQGYDVEDNEFRPYEAELDEFHPKATRTLFIGNLEKDVTASELRKHFEQFGEIIEIDIKKQGVVSSYAFCQYSDIASVVKAIRTMDGEHLGNNRIKLGFGKSMATNCVWVDGIADNVSEKYLNLHFSQFGNITHIPYAQDAVREMRGVLLRNHKLQIDFASRECQESFYEHLEKQGQSIGGERPWERYDSNSREVQAGRFETTVVVPGARFTRYETQQRPRAASYNRTANCSTTTPVATAVGATVSQSRTTTRTQRAGQRYEYYDSEYPDRRYRNYDEFSQGSAASHDDSYEQELRDYGYCQRERGDSSPSPGACEGETSLRRSVAVVAARPAKSCSPGDKVSCNEDDPAYKRHSLQSVVVSSDVATPTQLPPPGNASQHPLDIRHLQKERVHIQTLLDQLDSSGDDDGGMSASAPKKRMKLTSDDCGEPPPSLPMCGVGPSGMDMCYENHGDVGAPSLVVTTHNHRKSVSEVRRLSDVSSKHCSRRLSTDSASKHGGSGRDVRETSADRMVSVQTYSPHPVCKRRKTGSSTSESEDRVSCRSGKHSHHHHHHQHGEPPTSSLTISGGESVDGSRPGTPLCDERPENLLPPTEPRRFPRDRLATEGPLSLPLPRFAAQVLSTPRLSVSVSGMSSSASKATPVSSPPAAITSPRPAPAHPPPVIHQPPPSPGPAPPPASPPPRPPSLPSSSSSDSELSPPSPTLEERIRSLDEKYEKWSGSRALSAAGGDALAKLDASASERFRFRHKLLDLNLTDVPPSDIVKSVLAKRSVFDEDSKRLENFSDKYEPREFIPYTRTAGCFRSLPIITDCRDFSCATPAKPVAPAPPIAGTPTTPGLTGKVGSFPNPPTPQLPTRLMGTPSPLHSPSHALPKSPFSAGTPTTPTPIKSHVSLSPVGITPLHPSCGPKMQQQQTLPKTPSTGLPPAAKGLQYPFPSHPPVLPTTTVATTTATTATALVSVSSAGVKTSLSVTVPTSATGTVLSPEVTRTCVVKPVVSLTNTTTYSAEVSRSSVPRPSVTVLTTATGTKPTAEVTSRVSVSSKVLPSTPTPSSAVTSRVPSPSVLRIPPCVKPSTAPAPPTISNTSLAPEVVRTSVVGGKTLMSSPEVSRLQSSTTCTTTRVSSVVVSSSQTTPKVSSTAALTASNALRVSATGSKPSSTAASATSSTSPTKLSKPVEQSPKINKEHSPITLQSSNIPSIKSPTENPIASSCSPRVVIVPVSVSSTCASTVTTAVASSTATTTVLTMTLASTVATTTTFTTSMSTPTTNSSSESTRLTIKPKPCSASKKEQPSQPQLSGKDKQIEKQSSNVKKESFSGFISSTVNSSKKDKDNNKEADAKSGSGGSHKPKLEEKRRENVGTICARRESEKERDREGSTEKEKRRDSTESTERDRRKDSHSTEVEKERRKDGVDSSDREKQKDECTDNLDRRKDVVDSNEKDRWKDGHADSVEKERWKDRDENQERRKENHLTDKEIEATIDSEKRLDIIEKRSKERRKERGSSSGSPASIGCKRRMSSQDSIDSVPDDAKRLKLEHRKIAERRDSKDSGRSSSSSKRSSSERPKIHAGSENKNFTKPLEDKIREDMKHHPQIKEEPEQQRKKDSCEKHKIKDKKKKNKLERESPKEMREFTPKVIKETIMEKESSPKSSKKKEDSDTEEKESVKHKHGKREAKEKKKQIKEEFGSSEFLDEKGRTTKKDRDKRNSSERRKEDGPGKEDQKFTSQKKEGKKKDCSNSESDSEDGISGDGPKKHSIFDIVDDEPVYISMYDKVKARSTKNMQKQEEERRQEKMREKFNLLKQSREQSRAKREEKKRSTSWDEDSDSDNERGGKIKRHVKLLISSSSEDDGRNRYDGDEHKLSKSRPVVRLRKDDILIVKSDSDSEILDRMSTSNKEIRRPGTATKHDGSEDDDGSARTKHLTASGKKANRAKLVSDTSEDDSTARFKPNAHKISDAYSADSDADQGFADSDDKLTTSKKSSTKNNRMGKVILDSSNDESSKKLISDISKIGTDKQPSLKKTGNKNKFNKNMLDSSDDEYRGKFTCDNIKSETYPEEKLAGLKKALVKNRTPRDSLDSSDDESSRKLSDVLKADVYGNDKQSNLKKLGAKNKPKISMDSSDEENGKLPTTPKGDIFGEEKQALFRKSVLKNKTAKNFPDLTIEDPAKKFLSDTEKGDIFGDSLQVEKCSVTQSKPAILLSNSSDCEASASTPPPQLDKKPSFHGNSIEKSDEVPRKKSSKKKHKRQKNSLSSEDGLSKMGSTESELALDKPEGEEVKSKADGERKKHKRERRKSAHGKGGDSEDGKQLKIKKKKAPKSEPGLLKPDSSLKRDEKMENIFGPLSDDSEGGHIKTTLTPNNGGTGRIYEKTPSKWQVSLVYGSDSDSNASLLGQRTMECYVPALLSRPLEKERKRREKKKRDKKSNSLDEAARVMDSNIRSPDDYSEPAIPKAFLASGKIEKHEDDTTKDDIGNNDTDVFRFTDGDESLEATTAMLLEKAKEKEKKKKRKKSKEEKQSRREHHHHHHHEKSLKSSPERKLSITSSLEDTKSIPLLSPSLPSLDTPMSPPVNKPASDLTPDDAMSSSPSHHEAVSAIPVPATKSNEKKKPDKFIPGFGTEIDDIIHETAVKSISEFEAPKPKVELNVKEEPGRKVEQGLTKSEDDGQEEEKPRAVISQEETEDAVAALLGESFGADFTSSECYVGDGNGSPHTTTHTSTEPALPTDEEEETRKAIEAIDMKPDTPQSEPDLQIDTDTEGDPEPSTYSGLRFGGDDHSPHTSDGIDFSRPPKTPDIPSSYYNKTSQSSKPYEPDSLLGKSNIQPEPVSLTPPSIDKHMSPARDTSEEHEVGKPESRDDHDSSPLSPNSLLVSEKEVSSDQHKSEREEEHPPESRPGPATEPEAEPEPETELEPEAAPEPETEAQSEPIHVSEGETVAEAKIESEKEITSSNENSNILNSHNQEQVIAPTILVTDNSDVSSKNETKPEEGCSAHEPKEEMKEEKAMLQSVSIEMEDNSSTVKESHMGTGDEVKKEEVIPDSKEVSEESVAEDVIKPERVEIPDIENLTSPSSNAKLSPSPVSASNEIPAELQNAAVTNVETLIKLESAHEENSRDFRQYTFDKDILKKDLVDPNFKTIKESELTSGTGLDRNYVSVSKEDSGFVSVIKEDHTNDIARESDFSEPETDMKADNDFVANLLASDSMTQDDNSRPSLETGNDGVYSPFKEREVEVVSVIKEPDNRFREDEEEQDPFASPVPESPTSKENYEALAIHKDGSMNDKNDLSNVIKADSDFWSAKEVNIESVIKKVDALCSDDDISPQRDPVKNDNMNDSDRSWFDQFKGASLELPPPEEHKKVSEIQSKFSSTDGEHDLKPVIEQPKSEEEGREVKTENKDIDEKKEKLEDVIRGEEEQREKTPPKQEEESSITMDTTLPTEKDEAILSALSPERHNIASSPDEENLDTSTEIQSSPSEPATPRSTSRGGRGGPRGKTPTRVSGVSTRRTRFAGNQKPVIESIAVTPVSPRRGGRRRGGSGNRSSAQDHSTSPANKKLTTDVYEFRDDSEDEGSSNSGEKGRPRLILTIKSPQASLSGSGTGGKEIQVSTKTAPPTVPVVETREEFPSPAMTTRKSRRLLERDGSRTTVDDVIDDVVRSASKVTRSAAAAAAAAAANATTTATAPTPASEAVTGGNIAGLGLRPRRSTRQTVGAQKTPIVIPETPRKSPRGGKKQQAQQRRLSETLDELSEEKKKPIEEDAVGNKQPESNESEKDVIESSIKSPETPMPASKTKQSEKEDSEISAGLKPSKPQEEDNGEPTTLIDPVTGLLIPMRESEEGQYIPVTTTPVIMPTLSMPQISTKSLSESQELPSSEPDKVRLRAQSLPTIPVTTSGYQQPPPAATTTIASVAPQSHVPVISTTVPKTLPTTSATTSAASSVAIVRPLATCKPTVQAITANTKQLPQTLKAHVLQQTLKTTPSTPVSAATKVVQPVLPPPPVSSISAVPAVLPQPSAMKVHTVPQPPIKRDLLTTPATPVVPLPKAREVLVHSLQAQASSGAVGKTIPSSGPINPKAHLLQAVAGNKPPGAAQTVVVAPGTPNQGPAVVSKIHHVSGPPPPQPQQMAVNMKTSATVAPTPKAHLLQAAGGPPKAGNFLPQQKQPHSTLMNVGVGKVNSPPQPPKAHHGPAQQPILTGAVASPPLKAPHLSSQQPVGASSSRAAVPKPQVPAMASTHLGHGKGMMEPPKVEVSMGGCIMVPTASPQPRGQVLQDCRTAGLPVPYETQIGEVAQHVGFSHHLRNSPHDLPQHYVHPIVYHQYLRAHQEAMTAHIPHFLSQGAVRSPMVPGIDNKSEPDSEESRGSSPPLELRRPSSNGAVARGGGAVPHSLQSPHDRTTDSPQVATVYVHPASRHPHYTTAQQPPPRYYEPGAEPPPAHLRSPRHLHPLPGSEAPPTQPRLQVATPPHASQRYPVMWQGLLALKNDQAAVQMHFVFGNPLVARESLPCNSDGSTPPLRIAQRMRLEQTQVEGVARKMQMDNEHCMLLALPCGRDHMDVLQQSNNLQTGFITYLQQKQAAGIVNIAAPGSQQAAYVVHIFPSCDFANENLARIAPDLLHRVADIAHLLIIIATV
ncbi:hypothetical protein C0J52_21870 [Blattella germanica]|nr:hypothetical protein C0J52_21870 [Blattella germanica]